MGISWHSEGPNWHSLPITCHYSQVYILESICVCFLPGAAIPMVIQTLLHMDETCTAPLINFSVCKCQAINGSETASKLFAFISVMLGPF